MSHVKVRIALVVCSFVFSPVIFFIDLSQFDSSKTVFLLFPAIAFIVSLIGVPYIFSPNLPDGLTEKDLWHLNCYTFENPLLPWHAAGWNISSFGLGVTVCSVFKPDIFLVGALSLLVGSSKIIGTFISLKLFEKGILKRPESGL